MTHHTSSHAATARSTGRGTDSRRNPIRRTKALTALVGAGALVLSSCSPDALSESAETESTESATAEETPEDELPPPNPMEGTPVEAGTYTYEKGPFPVTLTTEETTYDMSRGGDPYRVIAMDPYGLLRLDFPVNAADLTQPPSEETNEIGEYEVAGPIDFPDDIGAWLRDAIAFDIVDEGTLELADGEAAWWDLQLTDPDAACFASVVEPCVTLWPYQDQRQIGGRFSGWTRLYAVETGEEPLMLQTDTLGISQEDLPAFLDTTDQIVGSITLP